MNEIPLYKEEEEKKIYMYVHCLLNITDIAVVSKLPCKNIINIQNSRME